MKPDIAIIGELNLDLILYGLPQDMPVERELLGDDFRITLGSSSAILAHNLASLGTHVRFVTCVGPDAMGKIALDYLRDRGIDLSGVITTQTATGVTLILPHGKPRHILTYPGAMWELRYGDLNVGALKEARHFHLSSLYLHRALVKDVAQLFRNMKAAGLTTSLDTNDDPEGRWEHLDAILPHVDIFLPNADEACRITRTDRVDEAIERLAPRVPILVVKLGAEGALLRKDGETLNAFGTKIEVVDTVGAGDTFDAGFLHQYVRGAPLEDCLQFANRCAAYSTTAAGGVEAFRDEKRRTEFLT